MKTFLLLIMIGFALSASAHEGTYRGQGGHYGAVKILKWGAASDYYRVETCAWKFRNSCPHINLVIRKVTENVYETTYGTITVQYNNPNWGTFSCEYNIRLAFFFDGNKLNIVEHGPTKIPALTGRNNCPQVQNGTFIDPVTYELKDGEKL